MEKVNIILVIAGVRPATVLDFEIPITSNHFQAEKELSDTVQAIEGLVKSSGLAFHVSNVERSDFQGTGQASLACHIFVAQDVTIVSQVVSAWQTKNTVEIGRLLGFPRTAVEGFATSLQGKQDLKELPPDLKKEPWAKFLQYRISENWKEEIKTAQSWASTIEKLAPHLYDRIVQGNSNQKDVIE